MTRASILFAKSPVLGSVKTRLIPKFGAQKATEIYRQLLLRNISLLNGAVQSENYIFAANDSDVPFFKSFAGWRLRVQTSGELGYRMRSAINSLLKEHSQVILMGADIADAEPTDIQQAFIQLEKGDDLVLGPSFDGGYWLIGTRRSDLTVFDNIPWSTSEVLPSTLKIADDQGLKYSLIAKRHDIDSPEDLRFL